MYIIHGMKHNILLYPTISSCMFYYSLFLYIYLILFEGNSPWKSQYQLWIHQLRQTLRPKRDPHNAPLVICIISIPVSVLKQLQPIQLFTSQLVTSSDKFDWDIPPGISAVPVWRLHGPIAYWIAARPWEKNKKKKTQKKNENQKLKKMELFESFRIVSVTSVKSTCLFRNSTTV